MSNSVQAEPARNPYAYVKGVDFNSQQKYDYNILSGIPVKGGAGANSKSGNLGVVSSQQHLQQLAPNSQSPTAMGMAGQRIMGN